MLPRWRDEKGQTGAEYMGVLLVVGAIVAGLLGAVDLDGRIAREAARIVCEISGGEDCGKRARGRKADGVPGDTRRRIRDSNCKGPNAEGDLIRDEGEDPTGRREADAVYANLGRVDDYFAQKFGRDSYDDRGSALVAWIDYCVVPGRRYANARWKDGRMQIGKGFGMPLDVIAHELTHGITERTAGLRYECQSGALNESISDIFASNIDGNWEIGEDLEGGPARDMARPGKGRVAQPAHVRDYQVRASTDDHGGVHYNSGIPNHAYYLMVKRIGRDAAEQIVYRALTKHLGPRSGFEDFRTASLRAARELYGAGSAEQRGVDRAFKAVGLDGSWRAPKAQGC